MANLLVLSCLLVAALALEINPDIVGSWSGTVKSPFPHEGQYNVEFILWKDGQYSCHSQDSKHSCFTSSDNESPRKLIKMNCQTSAIIEVLLTEPTTFTRRGFLSNIKYSQTTKSLTFDFFNNFTNPNQIYGPWSFSLYKNHKYDNATMCGEFCGEADKCNFQTSKCQFYCPIRGAIARNKTAVEIIKNHFEAKFKKDCKIKGIRVDHVGMDKVHHPGYLFTDYCIRVSYFPYFPTEHPNIFENALVIYELDFQNKTAKVFAFLGVFVPIGILICTALMLCCACRCIKKQKARHHAMRRMMEVNSHLSYSQLPQENEIPQPLLFATPQYMQVVPWNMEIPMQTFDPTDEGK